MRFDGRVWFRFSERAVWDFYRFVRELAGAGHTVALEWLPLATPDEEPAHAVFAALEDPTDRGRFLHTMLGLVHIEGHDAGDDATIALAAGHAGIDVRRRDPELVRRWADEARDLGVTEVPTMYRHGPVMAVTVNGAALAGDVATRARLILDVLDDDGVWRLSKP